MQQDSFQRNNYGSNLAFGNGGNNYGSNLAFGNGDSGFITPAQGRGGYGSIGNVARAGGGVGNGFSNHDMTMGGGRNHGEEGSFNPNTNNFTGYGNTSNFARQSSFDNVEDNSGDDNFTMPGYHYNQNMNSLATRDNNSHPPSPILRGNLGRTPMDNNEGKSEE